MPSATHCHQSRCGWSASAWPWPSSTESWSGCRNAPLRELQTSGREVTKVGVVGDERDVVVDADLCDQSIRQLRFETGFKNAPPQFASVFPVLVVDWKKREAEHECHESFLDGGAAKSFGKNDLRKCSQPAENCRIQAFNVRPAFTS